jgi:hypothetical protein
LSFSLEEALVDIKESSATLISNQQQDKTEVVNEIDKWKRSTNQSSGNINTSELFEKKLKEKDGNKSFFHNIRSVHQGLYESFHCLFYTFRDSMFCCFIDCEFNIGHFFWDCIQIMCDYFEPCLRFTENLENQDQTLIKEGTSVNVDNNIEPETIETREISEIKNNSEPPSLP